VEFAPPISLSGNFWWWKSLPLSGGIRSPYRWNSLPLSRPTLIKEKHKKALFRKASCARARKNFLNEIVCNHPKSSEIRSGRGKHVVLPSCLPPAWPLRAFSLRGCLYIPAAVKIAPAPSWAVPALLVVRFRSCALAAAPILQRVAGLGGGGAAALCALLSSPWLALIGAASVRGLGVANLAK